ncbi:MAG: hypothetical protein C0467_28680 [Planctomycetaceae bacterium]|nr:hypothetical protein [Planctomycetaceae bacterium]
MSKRTRTEIAQAVARLQHDGELVPVEELAREAGVSAGALTRWIVSGKAGCYLDGLHHPRQGWLSSRAALRRLQSKLRQREAAMRDDPRPAA